MKVESSATSPVRPIQRVEHHLITGILNGACPPSRPPPNQRQLVETIGVVSPLCLETLCWLTIAIAHGKPTQPNGYFSLPEGRAATRCKSLKRSVFVDPAITWQKTVKNG